MRKGIARMIEAVISSVLIVAAFSVSYYFLIPSSVVQMRSDEELSKIGFNLMSGLATNNGFENLLIDGQGRRIGYWEQNLNVTLVSLIPYNIIFDLTVYQASKSALSDGLVSLIKLNAHTISNSGGSEAFLRAGQTAQIVYVYTMKDSSILVFNLRLAKVGGM